MGATKSTTKCSEREEIMFLFGEGSNNNVLVLKNNNTTNNNNNNDDNNNVLCLTSTMLLFYDWCPIILTTQIQRDAWACHDSVILTCQDGGAL